MLWGIDHGEVAIWVLDVQDKIWRQDLGVEIIDVPTLGNARIRNQTGKFTLLRTPLKSLEEFVLQVARKGTPLRKLLLPANDAQKAIADLDAMGIHHGTVYPEIEGAAQHALFRAVLGSKSAVATDSTPRPA